MKLTLVFPEEEYFDDETQTFCSKPSCEIVMEHSLYTIAIWEEKFHKAFLGGPDKTPEEFAEYIRIMSDYTITLDIAKRITPDIKEQIENYLKDEATATTISDASNDPDKNKQYGNKRQKPITVEEIYWQMFHYGIPLSFEHWHLNRLLILIRTCQIKEAEMNGDNKSKIPKINTLKTNSQLNAARRAAMNSSG